MPMSTSRRRGVFSLGKYRFPVVGTSTRHLSQLVQPASSSQQQQQQQLLDSSSGGGGSSKAVKYTPCSRQESQLDNDELEEIAVVSVSGVESGQLTYGTAGTSMVNGPRVVPGIITSARLMEDRLSGSASRINTPGSTTGLLAGSDTPRSGVSAGAGLGAGGSGGPGGSSSAAVGGLSSLGLRNRSFSKHSLLEIVSNRISNTVGVGNSTTALKSKRFSRESFSASCVNKTAQQELGDLSTRKTREARRRDIKNKWKLDRWENGAGNASSHQRGGSGGCKWTFVFDPAGRLCYYWSMIVSLAFLYNFWVLIYRFAFQEIASDTLVMWLCLDYFCDLIYVLDIAFHFRTGYLDEGVLQTDSNKLRQHYMNSTTFYVDCLCLLPLDFLYLSIGFNSMLRCFRLVKIYRFWTFMDRTERHTNYPNVFRSISLVHYLLVIFHWNACLYHIVMRNNGFEHVAGDWAVELPAGMHDNDGVQQYLQSFYMCTLTLTTMGGFLKPRTKPELLFVIVQLIFGLMLFATVLGHVSNIVINVSAARKEFQAKLDAVKTYMRMRRVPQHLQVKVIKWFDYLWFTQKSSDEEKAVGGLPDKLKAEIAIHVHLDTLKRVEIFQNTEAGFLCELVLRLRPVLFSPGDYICRKGEVGKEMYIVNRGRLQVVADNGKTVLATLKAGSYFGEISILNMGTAGNRRTASVRSVGYSDLFVLSKKDMWDVLKEYPAARVRLEAIAVKRLEKYKKAPLEKAALGRSLSTPGLVESKGRIPLERMQLPPLTGHRIQASSACEHDKEVSSNIIIRSRDPSSSSSMESHSSGFPGRKFSHQVASQQAPTLLRFLDPSQEQFQTRSEAVVNLGSSSDSDKRCCTVTSMSLIHSSVTSPAFGAHPSILPPSARHPTAMTSYQDGRRSSSASSSTTRGGAAGSSSRGGAAADAALECKTQLQPEVLVAEINRLRERLMTLESENAFLSTKLNRQQWEVENRLAEIEMQICGAASPADSTTDDNERNYESAI